MENLPTTTFSNNNTATILANALIWPLVMMPWLQRYFLSALILLAVFTPAAAAMEIAVLASRGGAASARFIEVLLQAGAGSHNHLHLAGNLKDGFDEETLKRAELLVAVGMPAVQHSRDYQKPVLAVMVSRHQLTLFCKQNPTCDSQFSAIVIDQPVARQIKLIRAVNPAIKKAGLLINALSTTTRASGEHIAHELAANNIEPVSATLHSSDDLLPALKTVLPKADVYLASPDIVRMTPFTARTVLLTSYRYHQPVFAFSKAYVDAGATAAVFSSPADIARDAAQWLTTLRQAPAAMPEARGPRYFQVATNRNVARTLGLKLPPDSDLLHALQASETQGAP